MWNSKNSNSFVYFEKRDSFIFIYSKSKMVDPHNES